MRVWGVRAILTGRFGGLYLEIGVCFWQNATQREIKEATKSHRRKTTAARFCVSRKNGGLLAEKQAPPKNKGVLVFPVRTALTPQARIKTTSIESARYWADRYQADFQQE
jgi:hypothetical protein